MGKSAGEVFIPVNLFNRRTGLCCGRVSNLDQLLKPCILNLFFLHKLCMASHQSGFTVVAEHSCNIGLDYAVFAVGCT